MTFKFAVGQKVVHVLDEGMKDRLSDDTPKITKQKGLVINRMAEECWGGVQNYYLVRWYTQRTNYASGGFLQDFIRMAEIEIEAAE